MKHARDDYQRIQDPSGLIPEDEPVFLLRAQDEYAAEAVQYYSNIIEIGCCDAKLVKLAREQAERMRLWPKHKEPDL